MHGKVGRQDSSLVCAGRTQRWGCARRLGWSGGGSCRAAVSADEPGVWESARQPVPVWGDFALHPHMVFSIECCTVAVWAGVKECEHV